VPLPGYTFAPLLITFPLSRISRLTPAVWPRLNEGWVIFGSQGRTKDSDSEFCARRAGMILESPDSVVRWIAPVEVAARDASESHAADAHTMSRADDFISFADEMHGMFSELALRVAAAAKSERWAKLMRAEEELAEADKTGPSSLPNLDRTHAAAVLWASRMCR
jgi:hypothetical protein